ncbi:hypothetical protein [Calothrix sp. CCY 0018]|uniref:hypothetical protein n=1 Tax=Calothrix sp. CCY 0018 TaxID=3103864 RepID=UPI0039C69849
MHRTLNVLFLSFANPGYAAGRNYISTTKQKEKFCSDTMQRLAVRDSQKRHSSTRIVTLDIFYLEEAPTNSITSKESVS